MLNNFAATQAGGTGTVTTTTILDSTIANADVASDAAIDTSKINYGNTLEIEGSSGDLALEIDNNVTNSANLKIKCDAGSARADFALDGSNIITMKSQMVGIGDTSPSYALDVNGTGRYVGDLIAGGNLTVGDGGEEDQKIVFNGHAQDFYVGLDDGTDDLIIGLGSAVGTTAAISINEDQDVTIADGAIDFDIASHDTTNGLKLGGTLVTSTATELNLLDGKSYVGDALGPGSSVDNAIARFDGTGGKTLQNSNLTISDDPPVVKVGDGVAEDTMITFDGNEVDYRVGLDDGNNTLEIGAGTTHGTTTAISIDSAADMTLGGYINFADELATRPELKDYSETYNESTGQGTVTLDMTTGNVFQHTADGGNVTFAFSNPPADNKAGSITLKWIQDSSNRTITWPGSVDWAGGSAPSVTSGSAKVDMYTFLTVDNGTIWYGFQPGADLG